MVVSQVNSLVGHQTKLKPKLLLLLLVLSGRRIRIASGCWWLPVSRLLSESLLLVLRWLLLLSLGWTSKARSASIGS